MLESSVPDSESRASSGSPAQYLATSRSCVPLNDLPRPCPDRTAPRAQHSRNRKSRHTGCPQHRKSSRASLAEIPTRITATMLNTRRADRHRMGAPINDLEPSPSFGQGATPSRNSFRPRSDGMTGAFGLRLCEISCSLAPLTAYTFAPLGPKDIFAVVSTPFGNFSETTRTSSSVIKMPPIGSTNRLQRWLIHGSACQAELAAFTRRSPWTCDTFDLSADTAATVGDRVSTTPSP